jgi:CHAT domain-containing protein
MSWNLNPMSDTNEQRQIAYMELIKALLQCSEDEKDRILAAHTELLDEGLVMTLLAITGVMLIGTQDPNEVSKIEWLVNFAKKLGQKLGLDTDTCDEITKDSIFSLHLLETVAQSQGNRQIVHQFLDNHLANLNANLLAILPYQVEILLLAKIDASNEKYVITSALVNLALDLSEFPRNRRLNLELAIVCYDRALLEYTRDKFPIHWAKIQMNRAAAYCDRIEGNKLRNLEEAIRGFDQALLERTREEFPLDWAKIQMNRAAAYCYRVEGNKRENLEEAIRGFDKALLEYTRDKFSLDWARTQMNRANTYQNRIEGDKQDNLDLAISGYRAALEIYTKEHSPIEWAGIQNNIAAAFNDLNKGISLDNLEESIKSYDAALEVYSKEQFPIEWAMTQDNRANAYKNRIKGDYQDNLAISIKGCDAALEVYDKEQFPIDWIKVQISRAGALKELSQGNYEDNLEESIKVYNTALKICNRNEFPIEWAMIRHGMAGAFVNRVKGDHKTNVEMAIKELEVVLEVFSRENFPIEWAKTQMNLASAYQIFAKINNYDCYLEKIVNTYDDHYLGKSINGYDATLKVYDREQFPIDWAKVQMNRAIAFRDLGSGDLKTNLEIAVKGYRSALEVFKTEILPIDVLKTSRGLGDIYFKHGEYLLAIDVYETAMQAVETSRSWIVNEKNRQQLLNDALSVYENAIQCAINLGNYAQAIQYTERIRSRQLVDLMGTKDLYPDAEIPADIQKYLDEYEQLNRQIQHLREHGSPDSDGTTKTTRNAASLSRDNTAILALEAQKREQYLKIRAFDPAIAGQIAVEPIDFAAIQKLITTPHTAILTCYTTDNDTHIFIIKQGQQPMLHTCTSQGWKELQQWLQTEWVIPYHTNNSIWQQNLPTLLAEISQRLQIDTLIKEHLTDITELIIVPHLNLHQIPFAALPINPTQNEASGSFLGDKFIIRSIPSCQILQYCQERPPITTKHIGTIEDAEDNLLGARYEGEQIAALYSIPTANRLRGSTQATVANYRELLTRVNRLHSSHHAISRPDNPIESALILANGERITLGDLLLGKRYRDTLDEVFLSACETHVGTATLTDDVATLTTGFLCIGARSVQSTLWSVDDLVTALFDIFYHQERRDDVNRALSLQAAQVRLRNLTGEEFKISHYPKLKAFIDGYRKPTLDRLEARMDELDLAKKTANQEEQIKINEEYDQLDRLYIKIGEAPNILEKYCQQQQPFESPYYWGAFTCQGMA